MATDTISDHTIAGKLGQVRDARQASRLGLPTGMRFESSLVTNKSYKCEGLSMAVGTQTRDTWLS